MNGTEAEEIKVDMWLARREGRQKDAMDLAKRLINLSGLEVKDKNHHNGDIEIIYKGLRPGEKIKEELSISKNYNKDKENQNIYICFEEYKNLDRMNILISELIHLIAENDSNQILNFLEENVEDYSRVLIN